MEAGPNAVRVAVYEQEERNVVRWCRRDCDDLRTSEARPEDHRGVRFVLIGWMLGTHVSRRPSANLGEDDRRRMHAHALDPQLDRLAEVRDRTLEELARRHDVSLFDEAPYGGLEGNNHFKWLRAVEDENGHAAQTRLLRKRLPNAAAHGSGT